MSAVSGFPSKSASFESHFLTSLDVFIFWGCTILVENRRLSWFLVDLGGENNKLDCLFLGPTHSLGCEVLVVSSWFPRGFLRRTDGPPTDGQVLDIRRQLQALSDEALRERGTWRSCPGFGGGGWLRWRPLPPKEINKITQKRQQTGLSTCLRLLFFLGGGARKCVCPSASRRLPV